MPDLVCQNAAQQTPNGYVTFQAVRVCCSNRDCELTSA